MSRVLVGISKSQSHAGELHQNVEANLLPARGKRVGMCHSPDAGVSRVDPAEPVTEWPWTMPQEFVGCRPVQPA